MNNGYAAHDIDAILKDCRVTAKLEERPTTPSQMDNDLFDPLEEDKGGAKRRQEGRCHE